MVEKAYKNFEFLTSRSARSLRILSEYVEPLSRFERYQISDTIVFFGSARSVGSKQAQQMLDAAETEDEQLHARQAVRLGRYHDDATRLARLMTEWSKSLKCTERRFVVCSGGGPGMMEAANQGASEAQGISVGLGISLPMEPGTNGFITRELAFEFHYFFMRKFWFVYLAKAMVIFPGGFGTMDELFELLTLVQTGKVERQLPIVLYGREFWSEIINFDKLVEWGTISARDLGLFKIIDTPEEASDYLTSELTRLHLDTPDG